ncbi:HD domain-containing protein [Anaerocolumna jejuensis]|uniref:HD domain-containing protein n=1 Tax=Anaerocolumna jejuensis TaxID=259063 RepID=UPI003F7B848D
MKEVEVELQEYINSNIIPIYKNFDLSHNVSHALEVIDASIKLGKQNNVDLNMMFCIAAYHDVGMLVNRNEHEKYSKEYLLADKKLTKWFMDEQIKIMAEAVEDHRASSRKKPRSIYGLIVSDSDRSADLDSIMIKTYNYFRHSYPNDDFESHFEKAYAWIVDKDGKDGYMQIFIDQEKIDKLTEIKKLVMDKEYIKERYIKVNNINLYSFHETHTSEIK